MKSILNEISNLKFEAGYYYVGDLGDVFQQFLRHIAPVFLTYIHSRDQQLTNKILQLPQNWVWLPNKIKAPLLKRAFAPFCAIESNHK
jgi:hypothetical protein